MHFGELGKEPWYKLTGVLSNLPLAWYSDVGESEQPAVVQLRGTFVWQGQEVMKTSVAAEYPVDFSTSYGVVYEGSEKMKDAALAVGAPVPMASKLWDSKAFETPTPWEHQPGVLVDTSYLDCPDQKHPFIPRGQGAPTGLTLREHVTWAKAQTHPDFKVKSPQAHPDSPRL